VFTSLLTNQDGTNMNQNTGWRLSPFTLGTLVTSWLGIYPKIETGDNTHLVSGVAIPHN